MSALANYKPIGRWRIVEADIWDRAYLDLSGPATITITDHGRGEIAFGALQAGLNIEYSRSWVGFMWEGFDEMDEVSGDESAELNDDSIEIEFAYHNGDEAVLKAKRDNFFNRLLALQTRLSPGVIDARAARGIAEPIVEIDWTYLWSRKARYDVRPSVAGRHAYNVVGISSFATKVVLNNPRLIAL